MGAVSQWEREAIGERTRDALGHKKRNGERVGNIQFGYRLAQDGKHVEPDPGEQAALAEIARLRKRGGTLRGIAAAPERPGAAYQAGNGLATRAIARIIKQGARQAA